MYRLSVPQKAPYGDVFRWESQHLHIRLESHKRCNRQTSAAARPESLIRREVLVSGLGVLAGESLQKCKDSKTPSRGYLPCSNGSRNIGSCRCNKLSQRCTGCKADNETRRVSCRGMGL